ncbi:MAG: cytochrome c-type protein NapC, partial [Burkholderiales bacterium PBB5]
AATRHQVAFNEGQTCIDCHKGIAHTLPAIEQHIGAPKAGAAELPTPAPAASAASGGASK